MSFGERLFRMRKDRGLSLRALAAKANMDYSLLSKIENDLRPVPVADQLFTLLDALGSVQPVAPDELEGLLSSAEQPTQERLERLKDSKSLRMFMRRKPDGMRKGG